MSPQGSVIAQNFDAALHKAAWSMFSKEGMERIPRTHTTFLDVKSSTNAKEEEVLYGGLPPVPKVANDQVKTPLVDFSISPPVVYRHSEYRYQYVYTKVAADDDQYGIIRSIVGDMGEGMAYTIEQEAASLLNEGENTSLAAGWDGKPLFATDHNLIGNDTTYSNILGVGTASTATAQAILGYFKRLRNDQGFWTPVEIESIQVSPELAPVWRQLLASNIAYDRLAYTGGVGAGATYTSTSQEGDTAHQLGQMGLTPDKIVENYYLANPEDTIVIGKGHKARMWMREVPNTDSYNINDPKAIAHRMQARFSFGFTDARRILLVPGA